MSIRPIDLQVILPKSQSNPHNREHVVNKEALSLQQTQMHNKKESVARDNKVNELKQKDNAKVQAKKEKADEKKKQGKEAAKKKNTPVKSSTSETADPKEQAKKDRPFPFHRFDMKV